MLKYSSDKLKNRRGPWLLSAVSKVEATLLSVINSIKAVQKTHKKGHFQFVIFAMNCHLVLEKRVCKWFENVVGIIVLLSNFHFNRNRATDFKLEPP